MNGTIINGSRVYAKDGRVMTLLNENIIQSGFMSIENMLEMVTIGVEKWGDATYKIAVLSDESTPLIHVYRNGEEEFDLGVSLIDILCKDEINIVCLFGNETDYDDIITGLRNFLFRPCVNKLFADNLERVIYDWNRETDFVKAEREGKNVLAQYLTQNNFTPLPKYKKYITDYQN